MTKERWQQINRIFEAALQQPISERALFLEELCAGDLALRAEVDGLLSGYWHGHTFMDQPAAVAMAGELGMDLHIFQPDDVVSGRFRIVRFIGEGGMGEVYEAQDLELGLRIALKTIHQEIASDPAMLSGFKQELQLARQVTHWNVCRTFDMAHHQPAADSGNGTDITYFTMELLEGETLAQRLRRGAMTTEEALPLIRQMADALDAAHAAGVIHCDLKPSNVVLCRPSNLNGRRETAVRVVITDFGVSRSITSDHRSASSGSGRQPFGTVAYMAPEQLQRKKITPATDIYALGLVIHEMVTGSRPFRDPGERAMEQCCNELPSSSRLPMPVLNSNWESTILRCLQPDPLQRFTSAGQTLSALTSPQPPPSQPTEESTTKGLHGKKPGPSILWTRGTLVLLVLSALLGIWVALSWPRRHSLALQQLSKFTFDEGLTSNPNVSPDGKKVVYVSDRAGGDGVLNVWMQDVASGEKWQVTHERFGVREPDVSPDGEKVAYVSEKDNGVYLISSHASDRRLLAAQGNTPRFSPDGMRILYWTGRLSGDSSELAYYPGAKMYVINIDGSPPQPFQTRFADARYPNWLPDGRHVLFQGAGNSAGPLVDKADWWVTDLGQAEGEAFKTGAAKYFRRDAFSPHLGPLWWKNSIIFSAIVPDGINLFQFDISSSRKVKGEPEGLGLSGQTVVNPSISQNGQLFYSNWSLKSNIWFLPLPRADLSIATKKDLEQLTSSDALEFRPSVSRDGSRIAFLRNTRDLQLKNLLTGEETTLAQVAATGVVIRPDGSQVAYSVYDRGSQPITVLTPGAAGLKQVCADCGVALDWSADGGAILYSSGKPPAIGLLDLKSGEKTILLQRSTALHAAAFSPRSAAIALSEWLDANHARLWLVPLQGRQPAAEDKWVQLTQGTTMDDKPRWSPDGKWIYYVSDRDGFFCIWKIAVKRNSKHPFVQPIPVLNLHEAKFSGRSLTSDRFDFHIVADKLILNCLFRAGNIWTGNLSSR